MTTDKAAIAAWAARKKQRKAEEKARAKALQVKVDEQKFPPLDWGKVEEAARERMQEIMRNPESFREQFTAQFPVIDIPEVSARDIQPPLQASPPWEDQTGNGNHLTLRQLPDTVETFNEQHQTLPVIKGLSFDAAKGMYRARAYKNNRQINLYWGKSRDQAIAAIVQYRITGVNPNA